MERSWPPPWKTWAGGQRRVKRRRPNGLLRRSPRPIRAQTPLHDSVPPHKTGSDWHETNGKGPDRTLGRAGEVPSTPPQKLAKVAKRRQGVSVTHVAEAARARPTSIVTQRRRSHKEGRAKPVARSVLRAGSCLKVTHGCITRQAKHSNEQQGLVAHLFLRSNSGCRR
jgi:hypothetical protein